MQTTTIANSFSGSKSIDDSQTEEMIFPHLLASFDVYDGIDDALQINEYGRDKLQIESQNYGQLNSRDDIDNVNPYHDSHIKENSNEKICERRRSIQRLENSERRASSLSITPFASFEDDKVNDLCKSGNAYSTPHVQAYLQKERTNQINAALEMKQINLIRKKKLELLQKEQGQHDEQYQYAKKSSLSDLFSNK